MPRSLVALSMLLALASAVALYTVKYETRAIEAKVQARERAIEAARQDIQVMEAERAHLSRPERIAPLARGLGLKTPTASQMGDAAFVLGQPARATRERAP